MDKINQRLASWIKKYNLTEWISGNNWEVFSAKDPREYVVFDTTTNKETYKSIVEKGRSMEVEIIECLKETMQNAVIEDCALRNHTGDILVKLPKCGTVMIDSKNYSKTVPYSEVEKLIADLSLQNLSHGVLIAKGAIAKCQSKVKYVRDKGLHVFLVSHYSNPLEAVFAVNMVLAMQDTCELPIDKINAMLSETNHMLLGAVDRFQTLRVTIAREMERVSRELLTVSNTFSTWVKVLAT